MHNEDPICRRFLKNAPQAWVRVDALVTLCPQKGIPMLIRRYE